jgi:hypothetical protein
VPHPQKVGSVVRMGPQLSLVDRRGQTSKFDRILLVPLASRKPSLTVRFCYRFVR